MESKDLPKNQVMDEYGVIYSQDGKQLIRSINRDLEIYPIIEGCKVICNVAFANHKQLKEVIIPDTVTTIENDAFAGCTSLINIIIPKSVNDIGKGVFYGCSNLENIFVADGNEVYKSIDGVLFNSTKNQLIEYPAGRKASNYTIPAGMDIAINYNSLAYCPHLTDITLSDNVSVFRARWGMFDNDTLKLKNIIIPKNVTKLDTDIFHSFATIENIVVEEGNEAFVSIDGVLFDKQKTTLICYPEDKEDKNYTVPDGVTFIEKFAFAHCRHLNKITLPHTIKEIVGNAFEDCSFENIFFV